MFKVLMNAHLLVNWVTVSCVIQLGRKPDIDKSIVLWRSIYDKNQDINRTEMGRQKQQNHGGWRGTEHTVQECLGCDSPSICWDGASVWGVGVVCLRQAFPRCQEVAWVGGEWRDIPHESNFAQEAKTDLVNKKQKANWHNRQCCCTRESDAMLLSGCSEPVISCDHSMHIKRAISIVHVATKHNALND